MKIKISKDTIMTVELLNKILELHSADEARKRKLANYYVGKHAITNRVMNDTSKPNNKIVHSYGNYITDSIVGYFMGQPLTYAATEPQFEEFAAKLKEIFNFNDEQSENVEIAKDASKYGVAYELLYLDEAAQIRFKQLDAICSIPIYSNTLDEDLIYFIRYYNDDLFTPESFAVEVYSAAEVSYFKKHNQSLTLVDVQPHNFQMVPVAIYANNQEEIGDYELIVSLIDAYDKLNSDAVNDFEQFADAYLTLKGMDGTELEDINMMKEQRVLLLPEAGTAEWLTKSINDSYFQNTINNLDADIHKFAKVPDMMDTTFGNNLSGIAIKYKLMGLENKVAAKEAQFKKGIYRRIELISNILYLLGNQFDYLGVIPTFHRNLPVNELEAVQMANQVNGLVSDETMLSLLPFVNDAKKELENRNNQLDLTPEPIVALPDELPTQA